MKRYLFVCIVTLISLLCYGQKTFYNDSWSNYDSNTYARLSSVEITSDRVIVEIEIKAKRALNWFPIYTSRLTYIESGNTTLASIVGAVIGDEIERCDEYGRHGFRNIEYDGIRSYKLSFYGTIPPGVTTISIVDTWTYHSRRGCCFYNVKINNPRKNFLNFKNENEVKQHIEQNNDGICGIYELVGENGANLACVKNGNEHCLIYYSSTSYYWKSLWQIGDIKMNLRKTSSGIMMGEWFDDKEKKPNTTMYVVCDGTSMAITDAKKKELLYIKTFPTINNVGQSSNQGTKWTGTGFALKDGYIITNHHVVDGASTISVQGVNGKSTEYNAEIIAVDKKNDLALIKIKDSRFGGFGTIPYSIKNSLCNVGDDIFVLGYPLTYYMGEELKLTNGIVSSRSGYQGDVTTYQISAPVQPGNSGGPMFDKNGNLVGIINAGIPGAENVGYAIKSSYLLSLVNSSVSGSIIPNSNTIAGKSLSEKVKVLRNYVFYIKCK